MMTYFLCCGTPFPLQIQMTISSSIRRRAGSPLRVILNSSTKTPTGPTAFPFARERMTSVSSCIGAELLEACSRATGQGLGQCSGRASVTWRSGDCGTTGPIVRRRVQFPSRVCRSRISFTPNFSFAFLPSSSSLDACRGRPDRLLKRVFRVCVRRPRRSSACQSYESCKAFCQPSLRPCYCGVIRVGASSRLLSVAMLHSSQPPHKDLRTTLCSA